MDRPLFFALLIAAAAALHLYRADIAALQARAASEPAPIATLSLPAQAR